jgi:hypothetical protein
MLVGTVVRDIIQDYLETLCVGSSDQRVEISERAKKRIYIVKLDTS